MRCSLTNVVYVRALALILVGLAILVWLIPAAPMTGDGQYYIEFVRNNLQHGASSWHERRLLGPLIVRALPLDAQDGFFVLTTVSLAVTALLTWLAARELVRDEARALIAIPLLFGTWVVAPNLREFGLVDPLAWVFVAGHLAGDAAQAVGAGGRAGRRGRGGQGGRGTGGAWPPRRPRSIGGGRGWPRASPAPAIAVVLALTFVFPGSGTDAGAYVFDWVRKGLFSNGVARAVFLAVRVVRRAVAAVAQSLAGVCRRSSSGPRACSC